MLGRKGWEKWKEEKSEEEWWVWAKKMQEIRGDIRKVKVRLKDNLRKSKDIESDN